MSDFHDRHGLIIGVANRRSIARAIAHEVAGRGARVALTFQDERLRANVEELAATLTAPRASVRRGERYFRISTWRPGWTASSAASISSCMAAFAPRSELTEPFVKTTREGFRIALDVSAYSLIAVARAVEPLLVRRGGGSILTLTYLGSTRVIPNYNVMGVAKAALEASVRYLAAELGPANVRVNAVSAGPIKTLAAAAISGFSDILQVYRDRAPMRRNIDASEVARLAAFLLSDEASGITGEIVHADAGYHITGI
jgi:enoyl-[acyl-carrier protein] reductase I